jgi:hypothetical protein
MFQIEVVEKNTQLIFSMFFFNWIILLDNVTKYGGARRATDARVRRRKYVIWMPHYLKVTVQTHISIYIQPDVTLHSLFVSGNCSTCFGWYLHPSSGAHTTVSTASGICHTVTATCRYSYSETCRAVSRYK